MNRESVQEVLGASEVMPPTNRKHKERVFIKLYGDEEELLRLYNAINNTDYVNSDVLQIVTLDNAIYMSMKNDVAFIIRTELNLYEHQSTKNPNMPLRDLLYIAHEYQKLVDNKRLFSSKPVSIPTPKFVVFYNGVTDMPDRSELKLSDLYSQSVDEPELELKVTVLNINLGHNAKLMERCPTLKEYAVYVDKVRRYRKTMSNDAAVTRAVNECISEGVLKDFMLRQKEEVIALSIFEYNEKEVMDYLVQEAREDAYVDGEKKGEQRGRMEGQIEMLAALVRDKLITLTEASSRMEMTVEEFEVRM